MAVAQLTPSLPRHTPSGELVLKRMSVPELGVKIHFDGMRHNQ